MTGLRQPYQVSRHDLNIHAYAIKAYQTLCCQFLSQVACQNGENFVTSCTFSILDKSTALHANPTLRQRAIGQPYLHRCNEAYDWLVSWVTDPLIG